MSASALSDPIGCADAERGEATGEHRPGGFGEREPGAVGGRGFLVAEGQDGVLEREQGVGDGFEVPGDPVGGAVAGGGEEREGWSRRSPRSAGSSHSPGSGGNPSCRALTSSRRVREWAYLTRKSGLRSCGTRRGRGRGPVVGAARRKAQRVMSSPYAPGSPGRTCIRSPSCAPTSTSAPWERSSRPRVSTTRTARASPTPAKRTTVPARAVPCPYDVPAARTSRTRSASASPRRVKFRNPGPVISTARSPGTPRSRSSRIPATSRALRPAGRARASAMLLAYSPLPGPGPLDLRPGGHVDPQSTVVDRAAHGVQHGEGEVRGGHGTSVGEEGVPTRTGFAMRATGHGRGPRPGERISRGGTRRALRRRRREARRGRCPGGCRGPRRGPLPEARRGHRPEARRPRRPTWLRGPRPVLSGVRPDRVGRSRRSRRINCRTTRTSSAGSKGLARKASTPGAAPSATSPQALMMATGRSRVRGSARSRSAVLIPSRRGMTTSRVTTSGRTRCTTSRHSAPSAAVTTSNPSSSRLTLINCRITLLSSTTSTRPDAPDTRTRVGGPRRPRPAFSHF